MKRRFVECAVLLGIVMSVMFLTRTQEGIGHVVYLPPHPDTGIVSPDTNHGDSNHPPCGVDEDWEEGDLDPREFSDCGLGNSKGHKTSWALHAYGGKLAGNEDMHPDGEWQCQMTFYLKVDVTVSVNNTTASASVMPSISTMPAVPVDETPTYDGNAKVALLISGVCYHTDVGHHGFGWWNPTCGRCVAAGSIAGLIGGHCELDYRKKKELNVHGPDGQGTWIGVDVRPSNESHSKSLTAGIDFKASENLSLNLSYSTSTTSEISDHVGLIYGIDVEIGGSESIFWNSHLGNAVIEKQSKTATASGRIEGASAYGITAEYDGVDNHDCPGNYYGGCRAGKCPPLMP